MSRVRSEVGDKSKMMSDENQNQDSRVVTNAATIPSAQLQEARRELRDTAKAAQSAAMELEQLALLQEEPFEEAFCLSPDEVVKRYTAANARQIEWRRHACIELLGRQCPAEDICVILKMNHRTVAAIAAQEGQKIGTVSHQIADALTQSAMSLVALADTKKHTASFKDLQVGAGIQLTHAMAFKLGGAASDDTTTVELEQENEKLTLARKFLEGRKVGSPQMTPINAEGEAK